MISAGLGGLSDVLAGSVHAPARVYSSQPADLLIPLTAAVVARMRSIWTATCATVALTVLSSAIQFQLPGQDSLLAAGLFVVLVLGLLLGRRAGSVRTSEEATSWQGTTETRPVPREMASLPLVRAARWGGLGAGLVILAALPFFTSVSNLETVSSICLSAMVVISLVVLTGWAGQASFGQYAFAAVGTLVGGSLATHLQVPFLVAVPAAAAVSAGLALVLGFPALRVPGIFLMVVTFALAIAANALLFDPRYFGWLDPGLVHRPTLFVIDFEESQWMYALCVLMLIGTILAVRNLRRSRFGRLVIAARENPSDLQAAGISVIRTKLVAFGLSGGLAGLAGALLVFQQHGANQPVFAPDQSLLVFQMLIIGGAGTVSGALLGTVLLYGVVFAAQLLPGSGIFVQAIPLLLLYVVPGGLLEAFAAARDGVLRIIAQRNQMIVPALYGDVDPETLRLQLIPLAAPLEGGAPHGFRLATSRLRWIGLRPEGAATAPAPGAVEPPPEAIPEPVA
jgi:branched-chain amino acid transport system permease protein